MRQALALDTILSIINKEIDSIQYSYNPKSLFEPISYILSIGGKRVRPALALMSYNLYKNDVEKAIPAALGVEVFHNFTLLHDDLMDRADVRRGKPTVHIKWSENRAILSGDAMLIEAYKEICKVETNCLAPCLNIFSKVATEICCGQQLDMEFETRLDVTAEEYIEMIRLKTAVLLGGSLQLGGVIAGAPEKDLTNLYDFGINIGLAFQLMDDILDVYGDPKTFGKRIGGDILCNKKTYMLITALNHDKSGNLKSWIDKTEFNEEEKIKAVTTLYNNLNIKEKAEQKVEEYYKKAMKSLDDVTVHIETKQELYKLASNLKTRSV